MSSLRPPGIYIPYASRTAIKLFLKLLTIPEEWSQTPLLLWRGISYRYLPIQEVILYVRVVETLEQADYYLGVHEKVEMLVYSSWRDWDPLWFSLPQRFKKAVDRLGEVNQLIINATPPLKTLSKDATSQIDRIVGIRRFQ